MLNFNLNKKNIIKIFVILFLFFLFFLSSAFSYSNSISEKISKEVFRLHVIANSNSNEDQSLKYKVRDSLLEYMNSLCINSKSKKDAISLAKAHINDFNEIAKKTILENGYTYPVSVEIGQYDFPTKTYADVSLPAGIYDALRVKIGNAEGKNWWCVMFPPLCFVDVSSGVVPDTSKELLKKNLNDEEYNLITDSSNNSQIKFKFKIVEMFENIKLKLANN